MRKVASVSDATDAENRSYSATIRISSTQLRTIVGMGRRRVKAQTSMVRQAHHERSTCRLLHQLQVQLINDFLQIVAEQVVGCNQAAPLV